MSAKRNALFGVFAVFLAYLFFLFPGSAVTSGGLNFTVSTNATFNWTGTYINITSLLSNNTFFNIGNASTTITPQYFATNRYVLGGGEYQGFDDNQSNCFTDGMKFVVQNSSGAYITITQMLNQTNSTIYNLTALQPCPPGYYFGMFNVTQNGTSDWANVSASVNIPVNPANTFYEPNSTAYLKGTLAMNGNVIHKYYFNTSLAQNLTAVTINLSEYTEDIDLYLLNSAGTLLAKSAENGTAREEININLPATPDIWQLWIWGNVTADKNYRADMYFSTLNVTNASNTLQKIASINFDSLTPASNQSSQINITLNNTDATTWANVSERSEIYRVETSNLRNTTGDYYFLVPHYATRIKAKIEWTGGTRWNISLNDSTGSFIGNSSVKYMTGNLTGTVQEESILYAGTISESNDGLWKLTIGNASAITGTDYYNITVYVWQNTTGWISSTFPASGFSFGSSGSANSNTNVSLKLLLQNQNITNGTYQGSIDYYYPSGWNTRIPVQFSILSGGLLVNNTLNSYAVALNDNIGFNRLGADVLQITLPFNNTGGQPIYFANTSSNATLYLDSTHNMSFTVGWPANPIAAGSAGNININVSINTSNTSDVEGVYNGWITLNTINSTNASSSSFPFNVFNINVSVNLSSYLTVNITDIFPSFVPNNTIINNITANITVKLANGTIVSNTSNSTLLTANNFYDFFLLEGNTSYGTTTDTPLLNLSQSDTGTPWSVVCPGSSSGFSYCRVNGSLPANIRGGVYYLVASARVNTSLLGGTGALLSRTTTSSMQTVLNQTLIYVEDPNYGSARHGDAGSVAEGSSTTYTVNVRNYGPLAASGLKIKFDKGSCTAVTVTQNASRTCTATSYSSSDSSWTWSTPLSGYSSPCTLLWLLTAGSVDSNTNCGDMSVEIISNHPNYGNLTTIDLTIVNNASAAAQPGGQQAQTCTSNSTCGTTQYCAASTCVTLTCPSGMTAKNHVCTRNEGKLEITDYTQKVYVLQSGSNSTKVTVKDSGGYSHTVKLNVSSADGLTSSVSPASYSLDSGNSGIFTVNFSASAAMTIGYYTITLKAYASENASVYATKDITVAVEPLEETKAQINQTYDGLKNLFASIAATFNQMPPSADPNYTVANRTYYRLLNMLKDIENKIGLGNYLDAQSLINEANASLASFRQEIAQAGAVGLLPFIGENMPVLVAILVVIIVIGGFLTYLLLPPKKGGFHPTLGYVPQKNLSMTHKLTHLFSKIKIKRPGFAGGQKTLASFDKPMQPVQPAAQPAPLEKKTYMQGYHKLDEFPLKYDKDKFKERKK